MPRRKGSHNKDRPSYMVATREEYAAFYERIEQAFNVEDMTPERLGEWLGADDHSLIDQLSLVKMLNDQIENSENLEEIKILSEEIRNLPLHKPELKRRLESKKREIQITLKEAEITRTITLTQRFAEEKGIILDEKTKGGVYQKWGRYRKPAVVIFRKGKIKSWKYIK